MAESRAEDRQEDLLIVQACLQGDKNSFERIIEKYQAPLYNLAYRMLRDQDEALDIVQEGFMRAYKSLDGFKVEYNFFTWIYTITLNICRNRLRRRKLFSFFSIQEYGSSEDSYFLQVADKGPSALDSLIVGLNQSKLMAAIASLPQKYRFVIEVRFLDGLSYMEIAQVMDKPIGTVKTQIHRARQMLIKKLEGKL